MIRWANDNFESDFPVITTILVIMGAMALTTHFIGVHTVSARSSPACSSANRRS